ncbi:hypothetical protein K2173_012619 [Erythroxylum novogranatense]|uniref:Uncharacterized protein n=1 Tax=Erythroxylum novogranatense TaxID=1862640 RepID=A0AAV8S7H4_9ROSI|nr:hypothetical protein K2173_012619 [Erythroxylum novogranatense]
MALNVNILYRETIKPSSPTPYEHTTYKLSLLDQLCPPMYASVVLFYSEPGKEFDKKVDDHLKTSLSKALSLFYPFAGRLKDSFTIDCNDRGASYTRSQVDKDLSSVLNQQDANSLQQLLPCNPHDRSADLCNRVILAVQVNIFTCGGVAIGVCIWHSVADGSVVASFVRTWAAVARGGSIDSDGVVVDCTSLFPPQDLGGFSTGQYSDRDVLPSLVTKRFLFEASKITALREKIGSVGPSSDRPTRVESLSALIWSAAIAIAQEKHESPYKVHLGILTVDLRKRMNPPLPNQCIGNINQLAVSQWPLSMNSSEYSGLAGTLSQSLRIINGEYLRKLHADGSYLERIKHAGHEQAMKYIGGVITISSWCRFPLYETDFGWGKPTWLGTAMGLNNLVIFIDSKDGEGIEALVTLSKEDMAKFERNPGIVKYATFFSAHI